MPRVSKWALAAAALCLLGMPLAQKEARAHSPHDRIRAVAVSPDFSNDRTILCSLSHNNEFILKSTDDGETWQPSQIGFPHAAATCLAFSPDFANAGVAFAATEVGSIFKSADRGASWQQAGSGLPKYAINALALSPDFASDQTLFAGYMWAGVIKSEDGGATWAASSAGLGNLNVHTIAISPAFAADRTLFAGTSQGIYKSIDAGASWFNPVSSGAKLFMATCIAVSPQYSQDQTLFLSTKTYGIYKSSNGGATWQPRNAGLKDGSIKTLAIAPQYPAAQILVAADALTVYISYNGGALWSGFTRGLDQQSIQTEEHYFGFSFSPDFIQDRIVYLAAWEGVHKTVNNGAKWRHLNVFSQNMIRDMAVSPAFASDGTLFAGAYGGGVYRSRDRGDSWDAPATGLESIFVDDLQISPEYATDGTVFNGGSDGIDKSTLGGSAWTLLNINPADAIYVRSMAISPAFATDCTLFAGNGSEGTFPLYKTTDGGASFQAMPTPFDMANSLAVSPGYAVDETLFAGAYGGVYRSLDGGWVWTNVGLANKHVVWLALSPEFPTDGTGFAATLDAGLFKSADSGSTWSPVGAGITDAAVTAVALSPAFASDRTLFAATKSRGVFVSADAGDTWTSLGLEGTFIYSLALSPDYAADQTLFLGAWEGVLRSRDAGASWTRVLTIHRRDDESEFILRYLGWPRYEDPLASASGLSVGIETGALAGMHFVGHSITWIGAKAPFGGISAVYVDGAFQTTVDHYAPQIEWQVPHFTKTGLTPGHHTVLVYMTGNQNPAAQGNYVFVDAFEVGY